MSICYTAIKPSGEITLGNYFGTVCQWKSLSAVYQCFFSVADLHAITVHQDPELLHARCLRFIAFYMACGFDLDKATLYIQSHVAEHTELQWLLTNFAHVGELERMTQYKDKSQGFKEQAISAGLLNYPILMAADILLFQANVVPVGDDQKQHLELTREIIGRFNHRYQSNWPIPQPLIRESGGKLMGLQNPDKKMSKSEGGENNVIFFTDNMKSVQKKIMKAVTDSDGTIAFDPIKRPGISNLISLYATLSNKSIWAVCQQFDGHGYGHFKQDLAELVVSVMAPIQAQMHSYLNDPGMLLAIARQGADKARVVAQQNLAVFKDVMGLVAR
ncbi:MAG: tryptophan--tRNA ligase [Gammaproteobacteria bacterium]|nr:tryptophan--tRNA ligase [Gammaproteobacteria bacterium]